MKGPAVDRAVCLVVVIAVSHVIGSAAGSTTELYKAQWQLWKTSRGKSYASAEEEAMRYSVWVDNMDYIEQHNQNAKDHGYSLKINSFGDLTIEEWVTFYRCHRPESIDASASLSPSARPHKALTNGDHSLSSVPAAVDWRTRHKVTRVKNQGEYRCHSCYAFSSTAALESAHAIRTGKLYSLSPQQILDCSRLYYNAGCQGGNYRHAWTYIMDNGIASITSYPYQSVEGSCQSQDVEVAANMQHYQLVEQGSEDAVMRAVADNGPTVVSIDHRTRSFMFYSRGVYSSHMCNTHYSTLTHEMVVVGYNSANSTGSPYWIIKNSYGSEWGIDGYIHMVRNKNMCGIAMDAAYPII